MPIIKSCLILVNKQLKTTCSKLSFFGGGTFNAAGNNMFKVNNRNTRTRCYRLQHRRRSGAFIVNFEHIFTPCSSVSIVNFEQVNDGWEG